MNSDLFWDCFVETVVQMCFFWVQRSLLFRNFQIWLIRGLVGAGPPQVRQFRPFLEFIVLSVHLYSRFHCCLDATSLSLSFNLLHWFLYLRFGIHIISVCCKLRWPHIVQGVARTFMIPCNTLLSSFRGLSYTKALYDSGICWKTENGSY